MRLQIFVLTIGCLGTAPAWAGAGLTSAGVDPTPANNQQSEPTLAQVAPQGTQGTTGTVTGTVPAGVTPVTAAQAGTASIAGAAVPNGATGGAAAAAPVVVAPPPPPDPATLPVSVIRPVNKTGSATPASVDAAASADGAAASLQQARVAKAPLTDRPSAAATSASPPPAASAPTGLRPTVAPRADAAVRTAPETPTDEPADASASGFIFYAGVGIAATILLLSLAAFFRGGGGEAGKPRSM